MRRRGRVRRIPAGPYLRTDRRALLPPCVHLLAPCHILHLIHSSLSVCHLLCLPPVLSYPTCIPETIYARTVVYDSDGGVFKVFPAPEAGGSITVTLAVGETVILLHPPLPLVGVSIAMERGCQQNGRTPANG